MKNLYFLSFILIPSLSWSDEPNKYPCNTFIQVPLYNETVEIYYSGFDPENQEIMERIGISSFKEAKKLLEKPERAPISKERIDQYRKKQLEHNRVQLRHHMQTPGARNDVINWYQQKVALSACYASFGYPQDVPFHRCSFAPKGKYEIPPGTVCQPI